MDKEIKREARKQFFHYFRVWFAIVGILAAVCAAFGIGRLLRSGDARGNTSASAQRVFDYADVLTGEEEDRLREYIAECERRYHFDIVLVTINEDVESRGNWETVMMNYADDFYDEGNYGYDKAHGDGALLLDNWYMEDGVSQQGSWLATCGSVYHAFGNWENDRVLDVVGKNVESDPYRAYRDGIEEICILMTATEVELPAFPWGMVFILPLVIALVYATIHLRQSPAKDTTTATTYVEGGRPVMREQRDDFIRKDVVSRRIQTNSGGGSSGGSGRSGGGGGHVSRSGVSHGGGGRRR